MKDHSVKAKEAYGLLDENEKKNLKKKADIEANKWGYIEDDKIKSAVQDELLATLQCTVDELESKCGVDTLVVSSPQASPGIVYTCSSRSHYAAAILGQSGFPKKFISACEESVNRLPQYSKQTLRDIIRGKMHVLMSESIDLFNSYSNALTHP
jgi:hypothetical protein